MIIFKLFNVLSENQLFLMILRMPQTFIVFVVDEDDGNTR